MKAVITLDNLELAKVEVDKDGIQRTLHLTLQQLADFLISSIKEEDEIKEEPVKPTLISPSLPPNTVKYAKMSDDTEMVFMICPETKATIQYHQTTFTDVPFPNMVFVFSVRHERLVDKRVYVYKDRFLREDTLLYRYPFSNVYNSGQLCYFSDEKFKDLVQLQTFPYRWLETPFNDHLYQQGITNLVNKPLRQLLEESQGKEFDYGILHPIGKTFHELAESLIHKN
jgi:hypothetical protein